MDLVVATGSRCAAGPDGARRPAGRAVLAVVGAGRPGRQHRRQPGRARARRRARSPGSPTTQRPECCGRSTRGWSAAGCSSWPRPSTASSAATGWPRASGWPTCCATRWLPRRHPAAPPGPPAARRSDGSRPRSAEARRRRVVRGRHPTPDAPRVRRLRRVRSMYAPDSAEPPSPRSAPDSRAARARESVACDEPHHLVGAPPRQGHPRAAVAVVGHHRSPTDLGCREPHLGRHRPQPDPGPRAPRRRPARAPPRGPGGGSRRAPGGRARCPTTRDVGAAADHPVGVRQRVDHAVGVLVVDEPAGQPGVGEQRDLAARRHPGVVVDQRAPSAGPRPRRPRRRGPRPGPSPTP